RRRSLLPRDPDRRERKKHEEGDEPLHCFGSTRVRSARGLSRRRVTPKRRARRRKKVYRCICLTTVRRERIFWAFVSSGQPGGLMRKVASGLVLAWAVT